MKAVPDAAELAATTLDRLLAVVAALGDDMGQAVAAQGLSVPRAALLWHLHHAGPLTQRALADRLAVTPRNVTGLVDALESTGFVTRSPHPSDRRATLVALTTQGGDAMADMHRGHRELAAQLFADLPAPGLTPFAAGLEHVLERLHAALRDGGGST